MSANRSTCLTSCQEVTRKMKQDSRCRVTDKRYETYTFFDLKIHQEKRDQREEMDEQDTQATKTTNLIWSIQHLMNFFKWLQEYLRANPNINSSLTSKADIVRWFATESLSHGKDFMIVIDSLWYNQSYYQDHCLANKNENISISVIHSAYNNSIDARKLIDIIIKYLTWVSEMSVGTTVYWRGKMYHTSLDARERDDHIKKGKREANFRLNTLWSCMIDDCP